MTVLLEDIYYIILNIMNIISKQYRVKYLYKIHCIVVFIFVVGPL